MLLNKPVYTSENNDLIYDGSHEIDGSTVAVTVSPESEGDTATEGIITNGQVIDCEDGVYRIHREGGRPSVIAAETVSYTADDTAIALQVYISGAFRKNKIIANPDLTDADIETLREKGIYLK